MKYEVEEFFDGGNIRLFLLFLCMCGVLMAIFCFDLGVIQYKEPVEDPKSEEVSRDNEVEDKNKIDITENGLDS